MIKPNFFIVGAPKSGTTSLYNYLKQHPQVYLPKKEIHYFCSDLAYLTPPLPETAYLGYYSEVANQTAIGDASVFYLLSAETAQKIIEFNPEARIIIMLRNPVQMVYSFHSQLVFNGDEPVENFEQALDAESGRRAGNLIPTHRKCPAEAYFYSSIAKYYEQVSRYTSVFPHDKLHIIFYDDFKSDTEAEYRKVLKFLHLTETLPDSLKVINANKIPRSKAYLNFLLNPPGFIKSIGRFFFPHHSKRRQWMMDRLWNLNRKFKARNPLGSRLKQRLLDMYKDDILKLGVLLNRDLSTWLKTENEE